GKRGQLRSSSPRARHCWTLHTEKRIISFRLSVGGMLSQTPDGVLTRRHASRKTPSLICPLIDGVGARAWRANAVSRHPVAVSELPRRVPSSYLLRPSTIKPATAPCSHL